MAHNRKLALSGVSLTRARLNWKTNAFAANKIRDEVEQEIIESDYLDNAPFKWVGISIRYGLKNDEGPEFDKIDPADGELPLAIEIDTHRLLDASEDQMAAVYRRATLLSLVHAGHKYGLKIDRMEELLAATDC